ncbi:MAG: hypothetical protein P8107_14660 [Spirochaetia bacterium]
MKNYLICTLVIFLAAALVTCSSPGGGSPDPSSINTPGNAYFVFVDMTNGNDGAAGTKKDPVDDINEGISLADTANKNVCVAAGTYTINDGTGFTLVEGVSLSGGYSADGNWTRNISANVTIITDQSSTDALTRAIWCGSSITSATVVDGFTINAGSGNGATAIYCQGDGTFSHNIINGYQGAVSKSGSYAAYIQAASPVLQDNTLNGGSHDSSCGIYMFSNSAPEITGNTINGGTGTNFSTCIYCSQSSPQITNNTLNSGSSPNVARCVNLQVGSTPSVEGNSFVDGGGNTSVAFTESADADEPTSFNNNGFDDSFDAKYLDFSHGAQHTADTANDINALDEIHISDNNYRYNTADTVSGNYINP